MKDLKVIDVRVHGGDSGFLIDDGKTSVLYDSGFAFTGDGMVEKIKSYLGGRNLDYIFLTHSHYDHVLGSLYAKKEWPDAKIIASDYAAKIFNKPSAKAVMRDLDKKFAITCGVDSYEDIIDNLNVDIEVRENDIINAGDMTFKVVELPGHTKCSIGFYLVEKKLLLSSETLGTYVGNDVVLPSFLVGYKMTLDSIKKVENMDVEHILMPHYGLLSGTDIEKFLRIARKVVIEIADDFSSRIKSGESDESLIEYFKSIFYHDNVRVIYPIDAIELNTKCMIDLIKRECL